jgi:Domain of unknown function (DUF1906)/Putative peptidoglycan binding domain
MALQGLDRAAAPPAATAKRMLDAIGGEWWNVYIGGPESGGHGWTPELVREYADQGVDRFMLTYVGRQSRGPLTKSQGTADGLEAISLARRFGYTGDVPLCLDVEMPTFTGAPAATIDYARAWCEAVSGAGARPGVYSNPAPLQAMAKGGVHADFVWIASWVGHAAAQHDPHSVPNFPTTLWPAGRAWQYAGASGGVACRVLGLDVDISVAGGACLARAPGPGRSQKRHRHADVLRRDAAGPRVERLSARLSYVRSRRTGRPYLDGRRTRFDAETRAALEAFQREHRLEVDGVYGHESAQALTRAVQLARARRGRIRPAAPRSEPKTHAAKLRALIDEVQRLEAETDRAWEHLMTFADERRRLLARLETGGGDRELAGVTRILRRMEHALDTLVAYEQRELAISEHAASPAASGPVAAAPPGNAPPPPDPDGAHPARLSEQELERRVERLDRALVSSRAVLIRRFAGVEKQLSVMAPVRRVERASPRPSGTPANGGSAPRRSRPKPAARPRRTPPAKSSETVRALQEELNRFTAQHLKDVGPLIVDGIQGHATRQRLRSAKFYLGYAGRAQRSASVPPGLIGELRHPRSPRSPARAARGLSRRRRQRKAAARVAAPRAGVATFDGRPVAAWFVPHLTWARQHGWRGTLQSGWRDPAYSEQLCRNMCGAPTCAGRCAGRTSHHVGRVKPTGAIDVSDYGTFGTLMRSCPHAPRIFNNLPSDPVHFSSTGN